MKYEKIYIPVKVSERPKKDGWYVIKEKVGETTELFYHADNKKWYADSGLYNEIDNPYPTDEWFEPLQNRYVFTEEELDKEKKKNACAFIEWLESEKWGSGISGFEKIYDNFLKSQQIK